MAGYTHLNLDSTVIRTAPTVSLADGLPATAVGPVPGAILTTVARLAQRHAGPDTSRPASP